MAPAYDGYSERVRGTSTYPPGLKENGGIFCHANAWAVVAAVASGDGDSAYPLLPADPPRSPASIQTRCVPEPYVYCQNIAVPEHTPCRSGPELVADRDCRMDLRRQRPEPDPGIRPTYGGLRIAPAIPGAWAGIKARRTFPRCARIVIEVVREGPGNEVSLEVNVSCEPRRRRAVCRGRR